MSTEETAELGRCDWVGAGVGRGYVPRQRGNFQIVADVSRTDVSERSSNIEDSHDESVVCTLLAKHACSLMHVMSFEALNYFQGLAAVARCPPSS